MRVRKLITGVSPGFQRRQRFAVLESLEEPWEAAFGNESSVPLETEASAHGIWRPDQELSRERGGGKRGQA